MTNPGRILVIDDEAEIGEFVAATAQHLGLQCSTTTDASYLPLMLSPDVTLIMLDLMMPEMDGVEALRLLSELKCKAGIVLMSGISKRVLETAEKLANTLGLFVVGHLAKPFQLAELENLLKQHHVQDASAAASPAPSIPVSDDRLRAGIRHREFVLHFQPQIDIESGAVIGVEALSRWQHPELGLIFPDNFIARMEELKLIDEFGWVVAEQAMEEVKQFADKDGILPRLALNASVQSLRDLKFPDRFTSLLKRRGLPTDGVILEITESGLINELSRTLDVLTRLRVKSVHLSIDDFGTGYAMMQQLVNIPATELKIDRSFVLNMEANRSDRVMVEKSIEIGHELGMRVIAEGVETEQQLALLRQSGCDCAQGYLFSRALPAKGLVDWLEAYRGRMEGGAWRPCVG